ncbi:hypothetical protein C8J57DRAFT_1727503 [Mycena rebaudengoi]|nr:hypothetical protein C8J57DRAFT_1727503 [Mycena rebaudengoi]
MSWQEDKTWLGNCQAGPTRSPTTPFVLVSPTCCSPLARLQLFLRTVAEAVKACIENSGGMEGLLGLGIGLRAECTILTTLSALTHHGVIYVLLGYAHASAQLTVRCHLLYSYLCELTSPFSTTSPGPVEGRRHSVLRHLRPSDIPKLTGRTEVHDEQRICSRTVSLRPIHSSPPFVSG